MIKCELVQVYHHQPQSRVLLDPVHHIIYPGDYPVQAHPWGLVLGKFPLHSGWATETYFLTLVVACATGQSIIMSLHLVTGKLQVLMAITVDVVWMVC
jgi:hypothetical protein